MVLWSWDVTNPAVLTSWLRQVAMETLDYNYDPLLVSSLML